MGEGIDTKLGESGLGFTEFDFAEEEFGQRRGVLIVGDERSGEEREFGFEGLEVELRFVMELGCVKEDEERERARRFGKEAAEELVVEVDYARFGLRSEVLELRSS